MSKLSIYILKYPEEAVPELQIRMTKKGYSTWSLPKYKHGYLSACLTSFDYHKACKIQAYVSIACMTDNLEDMIEWIDSLPIIEPTPSQPITIPHDGEMFI